MSDPRPKVSNPVLIETMIDEWHDSDGLDIPLHEFLGWTFAEYGHWVERGELPE